ncbi:MAG: chemotaxis protein [Novosphingobium sp.]|nr:chemotaxis protein [Novosphingobium sp.]
MRWFKETAPIRLKLLVAFGLLWSLTASVTVASVVFGGTSVWIIGAGVTVISGIACIAFREAIAGPYVATVVRMEALAAGDLTSPIEFTGYTDCVGRMTKAMFTFKEAAATQLAQKAEADRNSDVVRTMSSNMEKLADGDLTADITADFPTSYAALKASFNQALANLRDVIGGVSNGTEAIRTGSSEIAQASEDLARRTEGNAASLEETSAALVQIEARLKASAAAAQGTVARADRAIASVGSGRATAETAMAAMTRVSGSAKGIDDVIEGLDKIAFQTRVLAMNAAVEAGRAGDAGRGFAVVADLVSALAMRAEEEAKRARDQLSITQSEIVTAVKAVEKVDGAFTDISNDVAEVHKLLAGMASDNVAQSAAVTEISAAVGSMDKATQQNAAMVEETSAAARNLTAEVAALAEQAAKFQLDRPRPAARIAAAPVKAASAPALRLASANGSKLIGRGRERAADQEWANC